MVTTSMKEREKWNESKRNYHRQSHYRKVPRWGVSSGARRNWKCFIKNLKCFYKVSYIFGTSKCATNYRNIFEVYDGFIQGLDPQRVSFFKNSKLLGLNRQVGLNFYEAFGVFLAKLLALFWHCESLVHGKMYLVLFPTKNFGF